MYIAKFTGILLVLLLSLPSVADSSAKDLYAKYKQAVVKISVYEHGIPLTEGTGFFVGDKGYLITNYHVIKPLFKPGYTIKIQTHSGKTLDNYKIGTCSDERNIDLCYLKTNYKPTVSFQLAPVQPEKGEKIYVIGHPFGLDYTISDGLVSNFTTAKTPEDISGIQISAPISPGNSGGPIFDSKGRLFGIATSINGARLAQNLNFGIAVSEIYKMGRKKQRLLTAKEFRNTVNSKVKNAVTKISKDFYSPVLKSLKNIDSLEDLDRAQLSKFRLEKFKMGNGYYYTYVPAFYKCRNYNEGSEAAGYVCMDMLTQATQLDFSFFPYFGESLYSELNNKTDHNSRPVNTVKALQNAGRWEKEKGTLSEDQLKGLYSYQVKPWKCKKRGENKKYYIFDETESCTAILMNDTEPNAMTKIMLFLDKKNGVIIKVAGHIKDSNYKKLGFTGSKISTRFIQFVPKEVIERQLSSDRDN